MDAGPETPVSEVSQAVSSAANPAAGLQIPVGYLEQLCEHNDPKILERGVKIGLTLLDNLQDPLDGSEEPCAQRWRPTIHGLRNGVEPFEKLIVVTGSPGCGKTALIMAILDEPKLVPTGVAPPMPIEFKYNYSDDPTEAYRAEIQFLEQPEFLSELRELSSLLAFEDEADSAYDKLKHLLPGVSRKVMQDSTPTELAGQLPAKRRLGKQIKVASDSAESFSEKLRLYIDPANAQLVKQIKIYTKSQALSTGVNIVDLPRKPRSNSAQKAAVDEYLKSSAGVWVIVPAPHIITTSNMDILLDESFKRQLNYDGLEASVTLIVTKTDGIHYDKGPFEINADKEISELRKKLRSLNRSEENIRTDLQELVVRQRSLREQVSGLSMKNDVAMKPIGTDEKRIRDESPDKPRKSLKTTKLTREHSQPPQSHHTLPEGEASRGNTSLEGQETTFRDEIRDNETRIDNLEKDAKQISLQQQHIVDEISSRGLDKMKDHLRRELIRQFHINNVAGYKAKSMKVATPTIFCVSSKVYGAFYGKRKDTNFRNRGFISTHETEVPQLQEYTKETTQAERIDKCHAFLNDLSRLINSMSLWTLRHGIPANDTDDNRTQRIEMQCKKDLGILEQGLRASNDRICQKFHVAFGQSLFRALDRADSTAFANAPNVFEKAAKAQLQHANTAKVAAFLKSLSAFKRTLSQTSMRWRKAIIQVQRNSIRMVVPSIRNDMMPVYQICAVEGGEGCFERMRDAMEEHIMVVRNTMFRNITQRLRGQLQEIRDMAIENIANETEKLFKVISDEYQEVLAGEKIGTQGELSSEELGLQGKLDDIIRGCDTTFSLAFD
ncbi:hypothetical protein ABKA04_009613 [Annulohypoxylon sp. FPYF3050]